jgi:hypothetical protein
MMLQAPKRACDFFSMMRIYDITLAFTAHIIMVLIASGSLRKQTTEKSDENISAAWIFALLSTFGLPWGGVPLSYYLGAGSWTWFLFAGVSLCLLKNDGKERYELRRFFAIANIVVIMSAISAFMLENGIPGDIPGIEGVGAMSNLEGTIAQKILKAKTLFLSSAIASSQPIYSKTERASKLLSFSYISFVIIAFFPSLHFPGKNPDVLIFIDASFN